MDKDFKEKWVAALRSGKYKQGTGRLRSKDDEYCCLGVLCDLLAPDKWVELDEEYGIYLEPLESDMIRYPETAVFPVEFQELVNLPEAGDLTSEVEFHETLIGLNDNGYTFQEIADIIEEQF